jgi:hypothetical protein
MSKYLVEAQRVVTELSAQIKEAEKLRYDKEFLSCLASEIELSILESKNPQVLFTISELGKISFSGIVENKEKNNSYIYISLEEFVKNIKGKEKVEEINTSAKKVQECLDLELAIKKRDLLDKLLNEKK